MDLEAKNFLGQVVFVISSIILLFTVLSGDAPVVIRVAAAAILLAALAVMLVIRHVFIKRGNYGK
ncbi:MAG: hypothetical protein FWE90_11690 [Defluviitaleaceae bacterium]|nr:hypothetical protein [Defluviitaleaceae bacterium]